MRKTTLLFSFILFQFLAYTQFPVVLEEIGGGTMVRSGPDYGASSITSILWGNKVVGLDLALDPDALYYGTEYWYEIDLPDHDGPETGWVSSGFDFIYSFGGMYYFDPECNDDFIEVTTIELNVRENAGILEPQILYSVELQNYGRVKDMLVQDQRQLFPV